VLPNGPSSQNDQGIKACSIISRNHRFDLRPPLIKGYIRRLWRKSSKTRVLQKLEPELLGKNTANQKMMDVLLSLITERASLWMGETTFVQTILSPTAIVGH
jgi:hypothetical protein